MFDYILKGMRFKTLKIIGELISVSLELWVYKSADQSDLLLLCEKYALRAWSKNI